MWGSEMLIISTKSYTWYTVLRDTAKSEKACERLTHKNEEQKNKREEKKLTTDRLTREVYVHS